MPDLPTCNLCGSSAYSVIFKEFVAQVHQIVKCEKCGLMYAFPVHELNSDIYVNLSQQAPMKEDDASILQSLDKLSDYRRIPVELQKHICSKGRILDVGCYVGTFLYYLKSQGWDVVGVELDSRAVRFARHRFGLRILNSSLESLDNANYHDSFDVVTFLHVIEHLDDPSSTVKVALRLLKHGGVFVVETPTYDSLIFRLLGRRERSVSCDGHIFFYTAKTLSKLLERTGFEILEWRKVGRTLSLGRLIWNVGVMLKSVTVQRALQRVTDARNLNSNSLHIYLHMRDMIRFYCRKP